MLHTHTSVSASVIKSTSRFAPKAVPRKPKATTAAPPKPPPSPALDEGSNEEETDQIESPEAQQSTSTSRQQWSNNANSADEKAISSLLAIQHTLPHISPTNQATPIPAPFPNPTVRSLRSSKRIFEPTDVAAPTVEAPSTTTTGRKRRMTASTSDSLRRGRRKSTPPAAEEITISPATMTMSEMCIDRRTGRKSSRYAELKEAERQRRRLRELTKDQVTQQNATPAPPEPFVQADQVLNENDDNELLPMDSGTTRVMTDANGNIVLDHSSLQVDRHAIHPATLTDSLVHTTETVFSSKTNSATYASNRSHASNTIRWFSADSDKFYKGLQMFGTDFGLIADYLGGGKTRRHVKNKFDREEKVNGEKVTWALRNRIPVDVKGLEEIRGIKLREIEETRSLLKGIQEEARAIMALPRISESQQNGEGSGPVRSTIISDAIHRN